MHDALIIKSLTSNHIGMAGVFVLQVFNVLKHIHTGQALHCPLVSSFPPIFFERSADEELQHWPEDV